MGWAGLHGCVFSGQTRKRDCFCREAIILSHSSSLSFFRANARFINPIRTETTDKRTIDLIEAAKSQNIKVAAIWKIRVNDRSKDMVQNIAGILKNQPDAKIIVFVGVFHAAPSVANSTNQEVKRSIENLGINNYLENLDITNVQTLIYQNTKNLQLIEIH